MCRMLRCIVLIIFRKSFMRKLALTKRHSSRSNKLSKMIPPLSSFLFI